MGGGGAARRGAAAAGFRRFAPGWRAASWRRSIASACLLLTGLLRDLAEFLCSSCTAAIRSLTSARFLLIASPSLSAMPR